MADVVVLGAGLGGTLMAYELVPELRNEDKLILIGQGQHYHFVPSNPWVAVGWRTRKDVELNLSSIMARKRIQLMPQGAKRVHPEDNKVELNDGSIVPYDYLVIATGPDLAFDEVPGFGPDGHTHSICNIDHAEKAHAAFELFCAHQDRSWLAQSKAPPVSGLHTNLRLFWIRNYGAGKSVTACP